MKSGHAQNTSGRQMLRCQCLPSRMACERLAPVASSQYGQPRHHPKGTIERCYAPRLSQAWQVEARSRVNQWLSRALVVPCKLPAVLHMISAMIWTRAWSIASIAVAGLPSSIALSIDTSDQKSLRDAAKIVVDNVLSYGTVAASGNSHTQTLVDSSNTSAILMGTLVDYWAITGDEQYLDLTVKALNSQSGSSHDFMPAGQAADLVCSDVSDVISWAY